jgi:uncharacterized protein (TIGR02646 family)
MVELQHRLSPPAELAVFLDTHNTAFLEDPAGLFDCWVSVEIKRILKSQLNEEEGGLCVYCESKLSAQQGHVEHILPKGKPTNDNPSYAHLTFSYTNLAHSCSALNARHCGHAKNNKLLPINPETDCNKWFSLTSDGEITCSDSCVTKAHKQNAKQTLEILRLTSRQSPALASLRKSRINAIEELRHEAISNDDLQEFINTGPFKYILKTLYTNLN